MDVISFYKNMKKKIKDYANVSKARILLVEIKMFYISR